jgi:hypothetical protein
MATPSVCCSRIQTGQEFVLSRAKGECYLISYLRFHRADGASMARAFGLFESIAPIPWALPKAFMGQHLRRYQLLVFQGCGEGQAPDLGSVIRRIGRHPGISRVRNLQSEFR